MAKFASRINKLKRDGITLCVTELPVVSAASPVGLVAVTTLRSRSKGYQSHNAAKVMPMIQKSQVSFLNYSRKINNLKVS